MILRCRGMIYDRFAEAVTSPQPMVSFAVGTRGGRVEDRDDFDSNLGFNIIIGLDIIASKRT